MTKISAIREELDEVPKSLEQAFQTINRISKLVLEKGGSDHDVVDLVIRLRNRQDIYKNIAEPLEDMISGLCREVGLIPYIPDNVQSFSYGLAREIYRNPTDADIILHAEQAKVFNRLARGEGLALSAPTSFGKSLLIDALIAARRLRIVVVVVPTIALLDETRRRMQRKFSDTHQIITLTTQNRNRGSAIYIGTQERIIERNDIEYVDLLVIDEFYKLDARQNDDRSLTLNLLLAKIGIGAKQIYLSGPLVERVEIGGALAGKISFYRSDFSPVAADLIDLTERGDSVDALIEVLNTYPDDQTLIYSGSPPRANSLAATLTFRQVREPDSSLSPFVRWAAESFHPAWSVLRPLHHGIGVHHGSVPRSVAQLFVKLFEKRALRILICTSTLIEGVNTSAKNICVFDKTINGKKGLSHFQFQNIKGRAGRLGRHYVGRIFLFNNPPRPDIFQPEIPALSDYSNASDEFVVQLPSALMDESGLARKASALQGRLLSSKLIERWGRYGIENLEGLAEAVWDRLEARDDSLIWSGWGKYDQVRKTAEFLWTNFTFTKHGLSAAQFAYFANCFRGHKHIRNTIDYIISRSAGRFEPEKTVEDFFDFLKGSEYTFPNVFDVLQDILCEYEDGRLSKYVDYSLFSSGLRSWFLPGVLKGLDEYGVPHPIIRKAEGRLDHHDFDLALAQLKALSGTDFFSLIENQILAICFED